MSVLDRIFDDVLPTLRARNYLTTEDELQLQRFADAADAEINATIDEFGSDIRARINAIEVDEIAGIFEQAVEEEKQKLEKDLGEATKALEALEAGLQESGDLGAKIADAKAKIEEVRGQFKAFGKGTGRVTAQAVIMLIKKVFPL